MDGIQWTISHQNTQPYSIEHNTYRTDSNSTHFPPLFGNDEHQYQAPDSYNLLLA
jgi:hypothetical protein